MDAFVAPCVTALEWEAAAGCFKGTDSREVAGCGHTRQMQEMRRQAGGRQMSKQRATLACDRRGWRPPACAPRWPGIGALPHPRRPQALPRVFCLAPSSRLNPTVKCRSKHAIFCIRPARLSLELSCRLILGFRSQGRPWRGKMRLPR
jgi:hypothetical protein